MTLAQLHPEELLDRDARGTITTDERTRLEVHLAQCSACRIERALREDFREELEGDDRSSYSSLVNGALGIAHEPAASPRRGPVASLDARRRRGRKTVFLLVAAALLVAGAAVAMPSTRAWLRRHVVTLLEGERETGASGDANFRGAPEGSAPASRAASRGPEQRAEGAPAIEPPAPRATAPTPVACVTAPAPSASAAKPTFAPPGRDSTRDSTSVVVTRVEPSRPLPKLDAIEPAPQPPTSAATAAEAPPPQVPAPIPVVDDAAELFSRANAARRAGDVGAALAQYRELEQRFGSSREAVTSHAIVGRMLLDRGDAVAAIASFDAYLRSRRGELREEAMAGRARALAALGRGAEETRAWRALLDAYPNSAYASHARARIGGQSAP